MRRKTFISVACFRVLAAQLKATSIRTRTLDLLLLLLLPGMTSFAKSRLLHLGSTEKGDDEGYCNKLTHSDCDFCFIMIRPFTGQGWQHTVSLSKVINGHVCLAPRLLTKLFVLRQQGQGDFSVYTVISVFFFNLWWTWDEWVRVRWACGWGECVRKKRDTGIHFTW